MNGFICGWVDPSSGMEDVIAGMTARFGQQQVATVAGTGLAMATNCHSHCSDDGIYAVIGGHPRWTTQALAQTGAGAGHAAALIAAYREVGEALFERLRGSFSLALYDSRQGRLLLALDRIGTQHLYYAPTPAGLAFASRADAVVAHPGVKAGLSRQAIYNYFYFHSVPSPSTVYAGVEKLVNGHYLLFEDGRVEAKPYWVPEFAESMSRSVEQAGEEMLAVIENSVKSYCDGSEVGAFLSGGLDSSTVSGMLARVQPGNAKTFSIGFDVEGYDETGYARIASKHFATEQHEYYVTPDDVVAMVPGIAAHCDEPFGNSSALPAYFCARFARESGVSRLLAGDGGDEIFAGNERYAKQKVFEFYSKVPALLRLLTVEPAVALPGARSVPVLKKLVSYVAQAKVPLPDRMETYNFLHLNDVNEMFEGDFLAGLNRDEPVSLLRDTYRRPQEGSSLNRMLFLDWKRTLHDNDLVKVNRMCEFAGVEVVYPLLDDALVEFSCGIPTDVKLKGTQLRWFYKQAVKNFLPEEIINKSKHGFGLPFGLWTRSHKGLQELAYDALERFGKRGIVKQSFIDKTIALHREGHAQYYGELVWVMMMLELWLSNNEAGFAD